MTDKTFCIVRVGGVRGNWFPVPVSNAKLRTEEDFLAEAEKLNDKRVDKEADSFIVCNGTFSEALAEHEASLRLQFAAE